MRAIPELFYDPTSEPCRAVAWFAHEAGIPIALRYTWLTRDDHLKPELAAVNPRRQVPALRDDDFCLSEATAIMSYLADISGRSTLLGTLARERARTNQLFSWYHLKLRQKLTDYFLPVLLMPAYGGATRPDVNRIGILRSAVCEGFRGVEEFLSDNAFLGGDAPSAADLLFACDFFALDCDPDRDALLGPFSRLENWLGRLRARPAYATVHRPWNFVAPMIRERLQKGTVSTDPAWVAEACECALGLR